MHSWLHELEEHIIALALSAYAATFGTFILTAERLSQCMVVGLSRLGLTALS